LFRNARVCHEARRIAANIAKLPDLLQRQSRTETRLSLGASLAVEDRAHKARLFPDCVQQIADQTRDVHIALPCHGAQAADYGVVNLDLQRWPMVARAACVLGFAMMCPPVSIEEELPANRDAALG
jgi:hypothetical protein